MDINELITIVTEQVKIQLGQDHVKGTVNEEPGQIPLGISNRHVHISPGDLEILFGPGAKLTRFKDLSQPGQFASEQMVTLVGPKGVIEKVRVLGPTRKQTQVEISVSDCFKLGVKAPIRDSGDLVESARLNLVGPYGSVTLPEGCIIAARHIHMNPADAEFFGVKDGDRVNVKCAGPRGLVFSEVLIRVNENFLLEMHLDVDEANAASLKNRDLLEIV